MSLLHSETCCICYDNLNVIKIQNAKKEEQAKTGQAKEDQLEIQGNQLEINRNQRIPIRNQLGINGNQI